METIFKIVLTGVGATLIMDLWAFIQRLFNIKSLDYRIVGRWIANFPKGKFYYENIMKAAPEKHEVLLGWVAHYLIGITFAALLVLIMGQNWLENPTLLPALFIGVITIVAPFFIMQPAFGFGIAASKTPEPTKTRLKSLLTHSIYGIGLYVAACFINYVGASVTGQ